MEGKFLNKKQPELPPSEPTTEDSIFDPIIEPIEDSINEEYEPFSEQFLKELYEAAEEDTALPAIEPTSLKEAKASPDSEKWLAAMRKELDELNRQKTWTLVPLPEGRKALRGRWVLKIKTPPIGSQEPIYKARWVAKGFQQKYGVDFTETYANTANPVTYRLLLALAAYYDWEIDQWDVKSAYPNASLTETVYVQQPTGFEDTNRPDHVCLLNKALYGLKQSAREWEHFLRQELAKLGLKPLKIDQSIYIKEGLILVTHVDDFLVFSSSRQQIREVYNNLNKVIILNDLGPAKTFLGIEITRDRPNRSIYLKQEAYTAKILIKYNKDKIKGERLQPISPCAIGAKIKPNPETTPLDLVTKYQQEVGSLMYLMTKTRPDLAYPIGLIARYMANPGPEHFKALERLWKYLAQTPKLGLFYHSDPLAVDGYTDSDWGGDIGTRRSTTGFIFLFRKSPVSWSSKLQKTVALSSCEAEYMALKEAIKEQLYIRAILAEIPYFKGIGSKTLYTDSASAIELANNPVFHHRTKHIDIQYHFVREAYQEGLSQLTYIPTEGQLADAMTKPVDQAKWLRFIEAIGLTN